MEKNRLPTASCSLSIPTLTFFPHISLCTLLPIYNWLWWHSHILMKKLIIIPETCFILLVSEITVVAIYMIISDLLKSVNRLNRFNNNVYTYACRHTRWKRICFSAGRRVGKKNYWHPFVWYLLDTSSEAPENMHHSITILNLGLIVKCIGLFVMLPYFL